MFRELPTFFLFIEMKHSACTFFQQCAGGLQEVKCLRSSIFSPKLIFINITYLNGATHERVALVRFVHDGEHVGRNVLAEVELLCDAPGEILHGLAGRTALQGFVRTHQPAMSMSRQRDDSKPCISRLHAKWFNISGPLLFDP